MNKKIRTQVTFWIMLIALGVIGVVAGAGIATALTDSDVAPVNVPATTSTDERPAFGRFPSDTDGDGVISDSGDEKLPALLEVIDDSGRPGYVRLSDFDRGASNPAEAVQMMKTKEKLGHGRVLQVLDKEGLNVIGTFTEGNTKAQGGEPRPPTPPAE